MPIDLTCDELISLREASAMLPRLRGGKPVHVATLSRWITTGVRSLDGRRVHLEAARVGVAWVTSPEALDRFARRLTPTQTDGRPAPSVAARKRELERIDRELDQLGV